MRVFLSKEVKSASYFIISASFFPILLAQLNHVGSSGECGGGVVRM